METKRDSDIEFRAGTAIAVSVLMTAYGAALLAGWLPISFWRAIPVVGLLCVAGSVLGAGLGDTHYLWTEQSELRAMLSLTTAAVWINMGPFSLALPLGVSLYRQACERRLGVEAKQRGYVVSEGRRNQKRSSLDRIGVTAEILAQRNHAQLKTMSAPRRDSNPQPPG